MTTFPHRQVIDGFKHVEQSLAEIMRFVPYCPAHTGVWSPPRADCIVSASLQLDSLWKAVARLSPHVTKPKLDITDYYSFFGSAKTAAGSAVHDRWVVMRVDPPVQLRPFRPWDGSTGYTSLPWWSAYTDLKHDRWRNIEKATLDTAVNAVAALFLAIARCSECVQAVDESGWLSAKPFIDQRHLGGCLDESSGGTKNLFVAVESHLFTYPVNWCGEKIKTDDQWMGLCSLQFRSWFDSYTT